MNTMLRCLVITCALIHADRSWAEAYALLVGVEDYRRQPELSSLKYAEDQVHLLAERLLASGYAEKNVIVMTAQRGAESPRYLPQRKEIMREFERLYSLYREDDTLIIAFCGQGLQFVNELNEYFCPIDGAVRDRSTLISINYIVEQLENTPYGGKLILLDTYLDYPLSRPANREPPARETVIHVPSSERRTPDWSHLQSYVLTSCSSRQRTYESPMLRSTPFFYFVNQALHGEADKDDDSRIALLEFTEFVINRSASWTENWFQERQVPARLGREAEDMFVVRFDRPREIARRPLPPPPVPPETPKQISNSLGMKLALIPAGEFLMGSETSAKKLAKQFKREEKIFANEFPQHAVTISRSFYMGINEVTQGEWTKVMGTSPWSRWSKSAKEGDDIPATNMRWIDCEEFCRCLSARDDRYYRLPTEAEWEYACRAGTETMYYFGKTASSLAEHAWYEANTTAAGEKYPHPVRQKLPNPWGLYDMYGNAAEWCADYYHERFYDQSPTVDPFGFARRRSRVARGGNWRQSEMMIRSSSRLGTDSPYGVDFMGFRVVAEVD